jgi:hypothetical protein
VPRRASGGVRRGLVKGLRDPRGEPLRARREERTHGEQGIEA